MVSHGKRIVSFGEVMLRLSPEAAGEKLAFARKFRVEPGGSEANTAAALSLLAREAGNEKSVETVLNRQSGVLGLSGVSADIRDVLGRLTKHDDDSDALLVAAQVYLWRIRKYLGMYLTVVGKADCVIFTDTIGERVPYARWAVTSGLEAFGLRIDSEKNDQASTLPVDLSKPEARVRILAIATNEEVAIARFSYLLLSATSARRERMAS